MYKCCKDNSAALKVILSVNILSFKTRQSIIILCTSINYEAILIYWNLGNRHVNSCQIIIGVFQLVNKKLDLHI